MLTDAIALGVERAWSAPSDISMKRRSGISPPHGKRENAGGDESAMRPNAIPPRSASESVGAKDPLHAAKQRRQDKKCTEHVRVLECVAEDASP